MTATNRFNRVLLFGIPADREPTPEENLWAAVVVRAVFDACHEHDCQASPADRRVAKTWFRQRSLEPYGWGWCIAELKLSQQLVRRIEDAVFGRNPLDAAFVGVLRARCKVSIVWN